MRNIKIEDFDILENYKKCLKTNSEDIKFEELYKNAELDWDRLTEIRRICNLNEKDYYDILQIDSLTTTETLKRIFKSKIRLIHPTNTNICNAAEATRKLQNAYYNTNTEDKRFNYEKQRESQNRTSEVPLGYIPVNAYEADNNFTNFDPFFSNFNIFSRPFFNSNRHRPLFFLKLDFLFLILIMEIFITGLITETLVFLLIHRLLT